jgi:heterodisulfide reductase subunit D
MTFDYGKHFGEMKILHDLTTMPDDRTWRLSAPEREPERRSIILYLGCNVLRTSHMVRTVTALFDHLGLDYVAVGGVTYCCGIVQHRNGDTAAGEGMSHHTVELFKRYQPDEVVMWCPSCIYFYDDVLKQRLPFRVRHTTEFLVDQLPRLEFTRRVDARVALHRHAVGEARQREGAACRRLLEALVGVEYVDIEPTLDFDRSCGPAVPQKLGAERWDALVRDELARAAAAGATTMATIYHGCQRMTCHFEDEQPLAIEHYLSVFARGLGIEFEDTYKKYRLWKDPERVLAEMTPCQQANRVDPARARDVVARMFPA